MPELLFNGVAVSTASLTGTGIKKDGTRFTFTSWDEIFKELNDIISVTFTADTADGPHTRTLTQAELQDSIAVATNPQQATKATDTERLNDLPEITSSLPLPATTPSGGTSSGGSSLSFTVPNAPPGSVVTVGGASGTVSTARTVTLNFAGMSQQELAQTTPTITSPTGESVAATLTAQPSTVSKAQPLVLTTDKPLSQQSVSYELLLELLSQEQLLTVSPEAIASYYAGFTGKLKPCCTIFPG